MLRLSIFSRNGSLLREKYIRLPTFPKFAKSSSDAHTFSLHGLNNIWKLVLGKVLGANTYTIEDNHLLIKEVAEWKKNQPSNISDTLVKMFIGQSAAHKNTTVFFENHWKYRFVLANLPILYLDHCAYTHDEFLVLPCKFLHILTVGTLPFGEGGKNLEEVAHSRKLLQNELDVEKFTVSLSKKNDDNNENNQTCGDTKKPERNFRGKSKNKSQSHNE